MQFTSLLKAAGLDFDPSFLTSSYSILNPSSEVPLLLEAAAQVSGFPVAFLNKDLSQLFPTIKTLLSCLSLILMLPG